MSKRGQVIWYLNVTLLVDLGVAVLAAVGVLSDLQAIGADIAITVAFLWLLYLSPRFRTRSSAELENAI